jgi:hypothetical protein
MSSDPRPKAWLFNHARKAQRGVTRLKVSSSRFKVTALNQSNRDLELDFEH